MSKDINYYLFSLSHRKMIEDVGGDVLEVLVYGRYVPFTYVTTSPNNYQFSDFKVVATSPVDAPLRVRKEIKRG